MKRLFIWVAVAGLLLSGCSGGVEPPTCDVYVSGNQIHVVVTLPAEGMDYESTHDLATPGMTNLPVSMQIETSGSEVSYSQTGNTYEIAYSVDYERGEITGYNISITGSVYGDEEFTCTK